MRRCLLCKTEPYPFHTMQCKKCSTKHQVDCMKIEFMDSFLISVIIPQKCQEVLKNTKGNVSDYPAMVVSCCKKDREQTINVITKFSESPRKAKYTGYFKKKLEKLGPIGSIGKLCKNPIGQCAEQHAAETFFKKNKKNHIKDILFSTPFRPRTSEAFDYCENCIKIFNL